MERNKFRKEEVISFVEEKITYETATQDELTWYENLRWNGKFEKNETLKKVLKQMYKLYSLKF